MNIALIELIELVNNFVIDFLKQRANEFALGFEPWEEVKSDLSNKLCLDLLEEVQRRYTNGEISCGSIIALLDSSDLEQYIQYEMSMDDIYSKDDIREFVMDNWDIDDLIDISWRW